MSGVFEKYFLLDSKVAKANKCVEATLPFNAIAQRLKKGG